MMRSFMRCLAGVWVVHLALLLVPTSALKANATPLGKVIELLGVLSSGVEKDGKEDEATYKEYAAAHHKEAGKARAIIKENKEKIASLQSDLKEAEAFREGKNQELVALANKLAKNEAELFVGRQTRKKDRAVFEKNEATFIESLDQLQRALVTLNKKAPKSAAAASASLLSVAQHLKNTLMHGNDFLLSTSQRETLDGFLQTVETQSPAAPSFLQYATQRGDFQSGSGGLITTLTDLKGSVGKEKQDALTEEEKQKKEFGTFESGLVSSLENDKKSLADIKSSIAQSQEQSSQKQASLMEAQEIFKVESEHLEQIETSFRVKTQEYKIRLGKRADEAVAVHEARRLLSTEKAKSYIKDINVKTFGTSASFVQISKENYKNAAMRRKVLQVLKHATTPGLALLALRSTVHVKHGTDPFAKVKTMIKGMLHKLNEKQAQESKHAAWCDKELGETTKNEKRKEDDVQKMKDRLEALSAELTQTIADIKTATKDSADVKEAVATAKAIRHKEHHAATAAIKTYKDGAVYLTRGLNILKGYYENKAKGVSEGSSKQTKDNQGLGNGVIGILEIAVADFDQLYAETKESEEAAAKDFKEMENESAIRAAVFEKDLEWKSKIKVKLEFDQTTMNNDLKSYEKELKAINTYMDQLKASCSVKGPSYAEKKARREAELASLREALAAISDQ